MHLSHRALAVTLCATSLVACKSRELVDETGGSSTAAPVTTSADAFCERIMAAPLRSMQGKCGPADGGAVGPDASAGGATLALVEREVTRQVDACKQLLAPRVEARRLSLRTSAVNACAAVIAADSWKESLGVRGVGWYLANDKACQGAMAGSQAQGAQCGLNAECGAGLTCRVEPGADLGSCAPAPTDHAPCSRPNHVELGSEARGACAGGLYCNFETATETAYAQASFKPGSGRLSPPLGAAFLEQAWQERADRRASALRAAAEFGMIGLLDTAKGDAGPGEGIGLGQIGTIGHGAGSNSGQGFGSGHGRLGGGAKPSKLQTGRVTVAGRLPPEVIQRIVRQNNGRFRLCYENGLRKDPTLGGTVTVRFVIGREGRVSNVSSGGDLPDKSVAQCIELAFYGLEFPAPEGGIVTVSYPIRLTSGDASKNGEGADAGADGAAVDAGAAPDASAADVGVVTDSGAAASANGADDAPRLFERGSSEPRNVCLPLVTEGGSCWESWQCAEGLRCLEGQCRLGSFVSVGGTCQDQTDCQAGLYCQGTCQPRKTAGSSCQATVECEGVCGEAGTCVPLCGGG
jgi:hypothetical protein